MRTTTIKTLEKRVEKLEEFISAEEDKHFKEPTFRSLKYRAKKEGKQEIYVFLEEWRGMVPMSELCSAAVVTDFKQRDDSPSESDETHEHNVMNYPLFKWLVKHGCRASTSTFTKILSHVTRIGSYKKFFKKYAIEFQDDIDLQRIAECAIQREGGVDFLRFFFDDLFCAFNPDITRLMQITCTLRDEKDFQEIMEWLSGKTDNNTWSPNSQAF